MKTTIPRPDDQEPCRTCGNSWDWHQANLPMHPFNQGDVSFKAIFGTGAKERKESTPSRSDQAPLYPFDPVLRQALVDKGILTPDDLDNARKKIQDMTRLFGGLNGQ